MFKSSMINIFFVKSYFSGMWAKHIPVLFHNLKYFLDKMEGKWARMDEEMTEKLENAAQ